MGSFAVIGLGRYGSCIARELADQGADVIAIDVDATLIDQIREDVSLAVRMDGRDERSLRLHGVDKVEAAIVAIGENFEASIMATAALKNIGVKHVVARAATKQQERILTLVNADEVVRPLDANAMRVARRLVAPTIIDYIELAEGHSVIQLAAPRRFHGHALAELDIRKKYDVNVVAIRKQTREMAPDGTEKVRGVINGIPRPTDVIEAGDILFIVGSDENLAKLPIE